MDHLTWIMTLQEFDDALPSGASGSLQAGGGGETSAQPSPLRQETAARLLQRLTLTQQLTARSRQGPAAPLEAAAGREELQEDAKAFAAEQRLFAPVFDHTDMAAISRFFERDARRYG